MITNIRIVQVESKTYLLQEEIAHNQNISIHTEISITKAQKQANNRNETVLRCGYSYSILYLNPSSGQIRFNGTVDYTGEGITEETTAETITPETKNEVMNAVLQNLAPLALMLSKAQGLPPAIPLPQIGEPGKKEEQSYYHG